MSDLGRTFDEIQAAVCQSLDRIPDTPDTQCATISVLLMLGAGLAGRQPRNMRHYWAKLLYQYADKLAE